MDIKRGPLLMTLLAAIVAFWTGDKIAYQVRQNLKAATPWNEIIDTAFDDVLHAPMHFSIDKTDALWGLAATGATLMIALYIWAGRRNWRTGEEHGSAHWGTPAQLRKYRNPIDAENLWFAQDVALSTDTRTTQRNLNAYIQGGSGSGKSRYYVKPNIYKKAKSNTSFILGDPKGELLRDCGNYLIEQGYKVRCLNVVDFALSDQFNCLKYVNPDQPEVSCAIIASTIVTNTSGRKPSNGGDFWEKAEKALLTALIAIVYFSKPDASLVDVVDLHAAMEASESDETKRSPVDVLFEQIAEVVTEIADGTEEVDKETRQVLAGLEFALSQYHIFIQGAGETKKSIIISLGVRLSTLNISNVRRTIVADTLELDRIGEEKTALFLITPDTHDTFTFLAALFYGVLFERLVYQADHNPNGSGSLNVPVHFFMDEFANVGQIPNFARYIAVIRSRGISVSMLLQANAQGKSLYRDDWEGITGNCDSWLFLGGNEQSSLELMSKRLGKQTIAVRQESETKGSKGSFNVSTNAIGRDLMTSSEVAELKDYLCLYLLRGIAPIKAHKLNAPDFGTALYTHSPAAFEPGNPTGIHWYITDDNTQVPA